MQTIDSEKINLPPSLLEHLQKGETVMVEDKHKPLAFIIPARPANKTRPIGLCDGEFTVPDDFDDPLPEIEALVYGEDS
jgi:antitoxin (DNA-binding transcriptional repressor) of toxin-antitoxin stability system